MIQAIIVDVDGIIVGDKLGYNSPHPHSDVLKALKTVRERGIPIILCTAKPNFSVFDIIKSAHLNNAHITDGGAVLIDPLDNKSLEILTLEKTLVKEILQTMLENNIYVEFYTTEDYYMQKDLKAEITIVHEHILQRKPQELLDLIAESGNYEVTKIMPIADDEQDKERIKKLLQPFEEKASISWGLHPVAFPRHFGIIVNKQTSKSEAAKRIIKSLSLSFENVLGVGDSATDWKFIELCGYAASVENGTKEIKELVQTKQDGKYTIGKSVDENGILDILKYFKLY